MEDQHLIFRIIEYGRLNQFFTLERLVGDLHLSQREARFARETLVQINHLGQADNPNNLMVVVELSNDLLDLSGQRNILTLVPNAVFQYIDYLEIVEARKAAQEARKLSWIAIGISLILGVVQIYLQAKS